MYKYRKRPVTIEAFQMTIDRRYDRSDWPEWLLTAWQGVAGIEGSLWPDHLNKDILYVGTLEGTHKVSPNDYIIQGIQGELYPCKPDIFEKTYEKV